MENKVRLPQKSIESIIQSFQATFAESDHLWIFGSRVDINARGGDIDLYVETNITDLDEVIAKKSKMISKIWRTIGEQRIDIVLNVLSLKTELPIYKVAKETGVQLV